MAKQSTTPAIVRELKSPTKGAAAYVVVRHMIDVVQLIVISNSQLGCRVHV